MAKAVGSRNPVQCRSHHQKMSQVYGNLEDIVYHYETKVIPYYEGRIKNKQDQTKPREPSPIFCLMFQESNSIRLELNASEILSY